MSSWMIYLLHATFLPEKKTHRPCVYCKTYFADLRSHFLHCHEMEEKVRKLRDSQPKSRERMEILNSLRKEGMYAMNEHIVSNGGRSSELIPQRASEGEKVICSGCHGTFSRKYFKKHSLRCDNSLPEKIGILSANLDEFQEKVLKGMDDDSTLYVVKNDPAILSVGKHIFSSAKIGKEKESRIKARTAMRRLAKLVQNSDQEIVNIKQLISVKNFEALETAIVKLCSNEQGGVNAGVKVALGSLIRLTVRVLNVAAITAQESEAKKELTDFLELFNLNYAKIFSAAEYQLKEKRQRENRKPHSLPDEKSLGCLRTYLLDKLSSEEVTSANYVQLRRICLARLTLLNGRRGSEVARMLIKDFEERNSWLERNLTEKDELILKSFTITYVMGKGISLIPIIIPRDCEKIMEALADEQLRQLCGIAEENKFLFAYTQKSKDPVTGYNEIDIVCKQLGIPTISATRNRHRLSTAFWGMEGHAEKEIDLFMEHMGHSAQIDKDIYCMPPAMRTLRTICPIITKVDKVRPAWVIILFLYFFTFPEHDSDN